MERSRTRLKCPNSVFYFPGPAFFSPSNSSLRRSAIFQVRYFPPVLFGSSFVSPAFPAPPNVSIEINDLIVADFKKFIAMF